MVKVFLKTFKRNYFFLFVMALTSFIILDEIKNVNVVPQLFVQSYTERNTTNLKRRGPVSDLDTPDPYSLSPFGHTNARKFAYGFFAVTENHLTAALVNIKRLKERRASNLKRERNASVDYVILTNIQISQRKLKLIDDVRIVAYPNLPTLKGYYIDSMVKLIFFNMTEYYRIIYMDIDALVMKSMDELFYLPSPVSLASPVAYWENELCFTSALLVIKPNHITWLELLNRMNETVKNKKADMDLINEYYDRRITDSFKIYPDVLLLPGYFVVLSSHFRDRGQSYYKGIEPIYKSIEYLVEKAYIVHFSGQLKPWDFMRNKNVLKTKSISKYFADFNIAFDNEFKLVRELLKS